MQRRHWLLVTLVIVLLFDNYIRFLSKTKIEIIHKYSKKVVSTIYGNHAANSATYESIFLENHKTYIVAEDNPNSCTALKMPPRVDILNTRKSDSVFSGDNDGRGRIRWILLSQLTPGCDFEKLVKRARNLDYGYSSFLLYGNHNSANVTIPQDIPTFFISEVDGIHIRKKYSHPKSYFVRLTKHFDWHDLSLIGIYDLIVCTHWSFQCLFFGSLLIRFFFVLLSYEFRFRVSDDVELRSPRLPSVTHEFQGNLRNQYNANLHPIREENDLAYPRMRLDRNILDELRAATLLQHQRRDIQLPTLVWQPPQGTENEMCAICLENFKLDETLNSLPCHHYFHPGCIQKWLTSDSDICPLCRRPVRPEADRHPMDNIFQELFVEQDNLFQE